MGYVYKFTHKETGKWYIGSHNKPSLNSKYTGSGTLWHRAKNKHGIDSYDKEILYEGENFREQEEEILKSLDAMNDEMSYNMINDSCGASLSGELNGMFGKKLTEEQRYKCGNAYRGKKRPDLSQKITGEGNPMFGKNYQSYGIVNLAKSNIGKTIEEIYGEEKASLIKQKMSDASLGKVKPHLSEKYIGEGNPFYGETHTEETREKMREAWKNPERLEKHDIAMKKAGLAKRGIVPSRLYVADKCEFCCLEANSSNITKWHRDNCKLSPNNPENIIDTFSYIECPYCGFRCKTVTGNGRRSFKMRHLNNCKDFVDAR